ncbi:MAG: glycosyltransferase [Exilibacterium sp.]
MRIFLQSRHRYPASAGGPGGGRVFDFLAKGLAELGHEVLYYLEGNPGGRPPANITFVDHLVEDADIYHLRSDSELWRVLEHRQRPWVATCHTDLAVHGRPREVAHRNWIYVSQSLARTYGSRRFVHNGIDPAQFVYSERKQEYLLFVSALPLALRKGLELAIATARATGVKLYVAGSAEDTKLVAQIRRRCRGPGVCYLGEIGGREKTEFFANARALIFPTQINEAFGLVLAEAMVSGTPVICSGNGACPELVTGDVGFICHSQKDYEAAVERVGAIVPAACRAKAIQDYHYLRMAKDYVREYEFEIERSVSKV